MDVIGTLIAAIVVLALVYWIWGRVRNNPEFSGKDRLEDIAERAEDTYQDVKDRLKK